MQIEEKIDQLIAGTPQGRQEIERELKQMKRENKGQIDESTSKHNQMAAQMA